MKDEEIKSDSDFGASFSGRCDMNDEGN